jgi:hypothetical protein
LRARLGYRPTGTTRRSHLVRLRNRDGVTPIPFELELATPRAAAGMTLHGELRGLCEPADVALVRIETCASGRLATTVASCRIDPEADDDGFALAVPADTPPTVAGSECELRFVVRARSPVSGRRRGQVAVPVDVEGGDRPVHEAAHLFDRMIASFPARHFHIELADALLEGGGRISGRVHTRDRTSNPIEVTLRCEETWRTNLQYRNRRQPPLWRSRPLWSDTVTVAADPDRAWQPFAFAIPSGLPPAVEGHIVCWRYEIEARRRGRTGRSERAVVTPLRFDIERPSPHRDT